MSETGDPFSNYSDIGVLYTGDNPDMTTGNKRAIDLTVFTLNEKLYKTLQNKNTHEQQPRKSL